MNTLERSARAEGVGLTYHPFLHDALLSQIDAYDFVELPLDLYADPARSDMLDPGGARLRQIAAAKPCVWSGGALSLGSVEDAVPDWLTSRIRQLIEQTGALRCTETIGFRRLDGQDTGLSHALPFTETAARWIAARRDAASAALGVPVALRLAPQTLAGTPTAWTEADFLHRVASLGADLAVDVADLAALAATGAATPETMAHRLPGAAISTITLAAEHAAEWDLLATLLAATNAGTIVLRRDRTPFPLDTIAADARRAAAILAQSVERTPSPATPPSPMHAPEDGLAALRTDQAAFIAYVSDPSPGSVPSALAGVPEADLAALALRVQSWQNWRMQVDDTHKAKQIGDFLSAEAKRRRDGA